VFYTQNTKKENFEKNIAEIDSTESDEVVTNRCGFEIEYTREYLFLIRSYIRS
jgi:hypothetical protein